MLTAHNGAGMSLATTVVLLFCVATGVALLSRPLRIPYTVGLVAVGLALGAMRAISVPHLTKELLYAAFLPGLLFEAAFHLDARRFWNNKLTILSLSVPGVILAIGFTAGTLVAASRELQLPAGFGWAPALVFGAVVSATDPVSVVALFKTLGAPARLRFVIEGESLVNDGTSIVFYAIAVGIAMGSAFSAARAAIEFVRVVGVGVLVGAAVGFAISTVIARLNEPVIEITLTVIAAYGSFILAEQFRVSGVLATVTAGMLCGSYGAPRGMSPATRIAVESFWGYFAYALNSIVFLLIGLQVRVTSLIESWEPIAVAYVVMTLARTIVVFLVTGLLRRTRERVPWSWGLILTWGGLRGALSMVLALALSDDFPSRPLVVRATFGVVILSILVNGLTAGPLLRLLGLAGIANGEAGYARE